MLGEYGKAYLAFHRNLEKARKQQRQSAQVLRRSFKIVGGTNKRTMLDWSDYDKWRKAHWEYGSFVR